MIDLLVDIHCKKYDVEDGCKPSSDKGFLFFYF